MHQMTQVNFPGYVLTQGIPESVLGVLVALNAASGVLGSLVYPHIRRFVLVLNTAKGTRKQPLTKLLQANRH